ncbi:hypothetical protein TrRE_jg11695, partial [Triparma retinervis]
MVCTPMKQDEVKESEEMSVTALQYNRRGTLLAVGYNTGKIIIVDSITMCILREIPKLRSMAGAAVVGIGWSKDNRVMWYFTESCKMLRIDFENSPFVAGVTDLAPQLATREKANVSSLVSCVVHPRFQYFALVTSAGSLFVLEVGKEVKRVNEGGDWRLVSKLHIIEVCVGGEISSAVLSKKGGQIFASDAHSQVHVYNYSSVQKSAELVHKIPVSGCKLPLTNIALSAETIKILHDPVMGSSVQFSGCCFAGEGSHVVGLIKGQGGRLMVWETETGKLMTTLEGGKEEEGKVLTSNIFGDIVVGTGVGRCWIYGNRGGAEGGEGGVEAFATNFQTLRKNVEYVEREDELDMGGGGGGGLERTGGGEEGAEGAEGGKAGGGMEGEEEDVDIITTHKAPMFESDSEDEEATFKLGIDR